MPARDIIDVLVNEKSGNAGERDILTAAFREGGMEAKLHAVHPRDFPKRLGEIVRARPGVVYIGGGDGSIRTAASRLHGTDIALGVLPLGTLNHFSQDMGIPAEIKDAVFALKNGAISSVDIGSVNGQIFINNASIGLYPEAVRKRESYRRDLGVGKYTAMAIAFLRTLRHLPVHDFHIRSTQTNDRVSTPFLFVGNNKYRPRFMSSAQRDALTEGRLSLLYSSHASRLSLLGNALVMAFGGSLILTGLEMELTEAVTVESRKSFVHVALDGEVIALRPPLDFRILPGALKVIVPGKPQ